MRKRSIRIFLDDDTAAFLKASRVDHSPEAITQFINSLLRQECFRRGHTLPVKPDKAYGSKPLLKKSIDFTAIISSSNPHSTDFY